MKSLTAILTLLLLATAATAAPVTFAWDDPSPGSTEVAGYRIYQKTVEGSEPLEVITYNQVNTTKIDKDARQFVFEAQAGSTYVLRAYNAGGESPDSESITIPAPPAAPEGFRTLSLVVEASPDMLKWATHAVLQVAAVPPQQFFRLRF